MRFVTSVLFALAVIATAQAQQLQPVVTGGVTRISQTAAAIDAASILNGIAAEESHTLFYFDISKPMRIQQVDGVTNPAMLGQRFTLPVAAGKLDSVAFFTPTIAVCDIRGLITRDTLALQVGAELFHLPNVYQTATPIDTFRIKRENIAAYSNAKAGFASIDIPQEFHIVTFASPRDNLQGYTLALSMDSIPDTDFNKENTRVSFISGASLGLMLFNTKNPSYVFLPQLIMSVNVRYEGGTGIENPAGVNNLRISNLYPQPASQTNDGSVMLECTLAGGQQIEITIFDLMGRKVRDIAAGDMPGGINLLPVSIAGLSPGTYQVRLSSEKGVSVRTLVVTK